MKQIYGMSKQGNLAEALQKVRTPQFLFLMSTADKLEAHVKELYERYPDVPQIGCVGTGYGNRQWAENGVSVVSFEDGVEAVANVLEQADECPVRYIKRLEDDMRRIGADAKNTVCIDICTGNDAVVVTTLHAALEERGISLIGGTGDAAVTACNGRVYRNASAYALIRNRNGRVKVYKENIYKSMAGSREMLVTAAEPKNYGLLELDGHPAQTVYQNLLGIPEEDIVSQTIRNPLGYVSGDDIYIISIKETSRGKGLICFKRTSESDVLSLLELDDYREVVQNTVAAIQQDFSKVSGVFAINCTFRYLFFKEQHYWQEYLDAMEKTGNFMGVVGFGEHFEKHHVNQTMCCAVFE